MDTQDYRAWIAELKKRYRSTQIKAAISVNAALLEFYWGLGHDISEKYASDAAYGSPFFERLSCDLQLDLEDPKGLSPRNLRYAHKFYELYAAEINLQQVVAHLMRIPWGHHVLLIDKCKGDAKKAFFYVRKTLEGNWSRSKLSTNISGELYERTAKAVTNFELKVGEFKPEHVGQLGFYMTAVDRQIKNPWDEETVGLVLCGERDRTVVEYALNMSRVPMGVAQYTLSYTKEPPKELSEMAPALARLGQVVDDTISSVVEGSDETREV